ncbi:MAG: hypothetical protein OXI56_09685 [bacterium]|nr:hypothetical protein [bacterium]
MKILLDQGTPVPLRGHLTGHSVVTAYERGWSTLRNSILIAKAQENDFHLLITTDQNLRHQQNLSGSHLAILVLMSASWPRIRRRIEEVLDAVDSMEPGDYKEISV